MAGNRTDDWDFRRCKHCGKLTAAPLYRLQTITVLGCSCCDFHATDILDSLPGDVSRPETEKLDSHSRNYIEERLQSPDPLAMLRLNLLREHCSLQEKRCLDIGTGVGQFIRLLAEAGALPVGLEPSGIRRAFAREKFGIDLHPETIEAFRRKEMYAEFFDIATLWDVIEHVNFPVETVEAARHVLKPGGLLFIDTPSRDALPYRLGELAYRFSGGRAPLFLDSFYSKAPFGHKQIFRSGQLLDLLERAGFEAISLKKGYGGGVGVASLLRPGNRIVLAARKLK